MRGLLLWIVCCLCFGVLTSSASVSSGPQAAPTQAIDLGAISRQERLNISIDVEATRVVPAVAAVQAVAKRAFNAHGAFGVVKKGEGAWSVRFQLKGGEAADPKAPVDLKVRVESTKGLCMDGYLKGPLVVTTLKLCDWALEIMQPGLKGFFASELVFVHDQGKRKGSALFSIRELCIGTLFFDYVEQLTHDGHTVISPHLSANRKKILYTSDKDTGFNDLFEYNRETGASPLIAGYKGTNTGGVYAPRGAPPGIGMVMMLSHAGSSMPYVANSKGQQLRRLVPKKPLSINASPSFSPDGKRIVFTSSGISKKPQLYIKDIQSSKDPERLHPKMANSYYEPTWNPVHPELIAFVVPCAGSQRLALYNLKKRIADWIPVRLGPKQIRPGPDEATLHPCWCADGRHLVFTLRTPEKQSLHLVDTLTGKGTRLTPENFTGSTLQGHVQY